MPILRLAGKASIRRRPVNSALDSRSRINRMVCVHRSECAEFQRQSIPNVRAHSLQRFAFASHELPSASPGCRTKDSDARSVRDQSSSSTKALRAAVLRRAVSPWGSASGACAAAASRQPSSRLAAPQGPLSFPRRCALTSQSQCSPCQRCSVVVQRSHAQYHGTPAAV